MKQLTKLFILLLLSFTFLLSVAQPVFAELSAADRKAIIEDTTFYDPNFSPAGCTNESDGCGSAVPLDESEIIKHIVFSGSPITPTAIVLHWTGGNPNASVEEFVSSIKNNSACGDGGCSVQLYIDGSGKVFQLVENLNTLTSHAGGFNSSSIGIEIAAGSDGSVATAEREINNNAIQKEAVIKTVAYLQQKFNIQTNPEVSYKKGVLSHHLIDPGRKSDVGDTYHQAILEALRSGSGGSGVFNPGNPGELPPRVRQVNFNLSPHVKLGQDLARGYGWGDGNQFQCLFELFYRESTWKADALNRTSGAYGIPQALPPSKMASVGADWRTNPATQIKWGLEYIKSRYRTPCDAIIWHNSRNWY